MKVAALYDIHGNVHALEAVLAEVPDDAMIAVGGDIVAGPMPRETLAALRKLGHRACFIRGNADRELAEGSKEFNAPWIRELLDPEDVELFGSLDHAAVLDVDGLGPTLFCHASPRRDDESITTVTSDERLRPMLAGVEQKTVVCGHTHRQFDRELDGIRVVNAGSVGRPYEGRPGAYWALLGPEIEFRRTEYDVNAAIDGAYAAGYATADDIRELLRDEIPPADEVSEFFERRALEEEAA
jgi:predicted phosphodiesterase